MQTLHETATRGNVLIVSLLILLTFYYFFIKPIDTSFSSVSCTLNVLLKNRVLLILFQLIKF